MQIDVYYRKNHVFVHHADVKFEGWPNLWVSTVRLFELRYLTSCGIAVEAWAPSQVSKNY